GRPPPISGLEGCVAFLQLLLRLARKGGHQLLLRIHELLDGGLELLEAIVVRLRHRTRNNEWRSRLVDEHGVHLVHDSEVMPALNELIRLDDERVVPQVIEAELIVRAVSDVGSIRTTATFRMRLVFVDDVDGETVKFEDRRHPLRITLSEVRVDGDEMTAAPGKGVQ